MSDHQTFCSLFKVRRHVIGCINHDIVVGLCSDLLIRSSYYIHLRYVKSFCLTQGSNRGPSDCEPFTLPLDQSTSSLKTLLLELSQVLLLSVSFAYCGLVVVVLAEDSRPRCLGFESREILILLTLYACQMQQAWRRDLDPIL